MKEKAFQEYLLKNNVSQEQIATFISRLHEFNGFLKEENIDILGEIHYEAIKNYVSIKPVQTDKFSCKSVQEWVLIGEKKRTERPIARPKALARTGLETVDSAILTDCQSSIPLFRK